MAGEDDVQAAIHFSASGADEVAAEVEQLEAALDGLTDHLQAIQAKAAQKLNTDGLSAGFKNAAEVASAQASVIEAQVIKIQQLLGRGLNPRQAAPQVAALTEQTAGIQNFRAISSPTRDQAMAALDAQVRGAAASFEQMTTANEQVTRADAQLTVAQLKASAAALRAEAAQEASSKAAAKHGGEVPGTLQATEDSTEAARISQAAALARAQQIAAQGEDSRNFVSAVAADPSLTAEQQAATIRLVAALEQQDRLIEDSEPDIVKLAAAQVRAANALNAYEKAFTDATVKPTVRDQRVAAQPPTAVSDIQGIASDAALTDQQKAARIALISAELKAARAEEAETVDAEELASATRALISARIASSKADSAAGGGRNGNFLTGLTNFGDNRGGGEFLASAVRYTVAYQAARLLEVAITDGIKETAAYQDALIQLNVALASVGQQGAVTGSSISQLGQNFGQTGAAAVNAAAIGVEAFRTQATSPSATSNIATTSATVALQAQIITGAKLADIQRQIIGTTNDFNLGFQGQARVLDAATNASRNYGVSVQDVLDGLTQTADLANESGLSIEQLSNIIGQTAQATGQTGSATAGDLKRILGGGGSPQFQTALQAAGVDANQPTGQALLDLASKWNTLSDAQQQAAITALGGRRSAEAILPVLQNYAGLTDADARSLNNQGAAADLARQKLASLSGQLKQAGAAIQQLVLDIGRSGIAAPFGAALEAVVPLVKAIDDLVAAWDKLPSPVKEAAGALADVLITMKLLEKFGVLGAVTKGTGGLSGGGLTGGIFAKGAGAAGTAATTASAAGVVAAQDAAAAARVTADRAATAASAARAEGDTAATAAAEALAEAAAAAATALEADALAASEAAIANEAQGAGGLLGLLGRTGGRIGQVLTSSLSPLTAIIATIVAALVVVDNEFRAGNKIEGAVKAGQAAATTPSAGLSPDALNNNADALNNAADNIKHSTDGFFGHVLAFGASVDKNAFAPIGLSVHTDIGDRGQTQAQDKALATLDQALALQITAAQKAGALPDTGFNVSSAAAITQSFTDMNNKGLSAKEQLDDLNASLDRFALFSNLAKNQLAPGDTQNIAAKTAAGIVQGIATDPFGDIPKSIQSNKNVDLSKLSTNLEQTTNDFFAQNGIKAGSTLTSSQAKQLEATQQQEVESFLKAAGVKQKDIEKILPDLNLFSITSLQSVMADINSSRGQKLDQASVGAIEAGLPAVLQLDQTEGSNAASLSTDPTNQTPADLAGTSRALADGRKALDKLKANKADAASIQTAQDQIDALQIQYNSELSGQAQLLGQLAQAAISPFDKSGQLQSQLATVAAQLKAIPKGDVADRTPLLLQQIQLGQQVAAQSVADSVSHAKAGANPANQNSVDTAALLAANAQLKAITDTGVTSGADYWDAVAAVKQATNQIASDTISDANAAIKAAENPFNADSVTAGELAQAQATLQDLINRGASQGQIDTQTAAVNSAMAAVINQKLADAKALIAVGDSTDPVDAARRQLSQALLQLNSDKANGADGAKLGSDQDAVTAATEAKQKAIVDQNLQTLQDQFDLQQIGPVQYLRDLEAQKATLLAQLATMKKGQEGYNQISQEVVQIEEAEKNVSNQVSGQFNLGSIDIPTPYEITRFLEGAQQHVGYTQASQVSNNTTYVTIDGTDFGQIQTLLQQLLGTAATAHSTVVRNF